LDKGTAVAHPLPGRCVQKAVGESRGSFTKQKKEHGQEMYDERYVGNEDASSAAEPNNAEKSVRRDITNLPHIAITLDKPTVAQNLKEVPHFMETNGSLPCTQQPTTCPYPVHTVPFSTIHFNIVLPSTSRSHTLSLCIAFSAQPLHAYLHSPIRCKPRPLNQTNNIRRGVN